MDDWLLQDGCSASWALAKMGEGKEKVGVEDHKRDFWIQQITAIYSDTVSGENFTLGISITAVQISSPNSFAR